MAKQRYLRPGDRLNDDDIVMVRGGDLVPEALRADAARYHSIYGGYGLSVLAARDVSVDELAQQAPFEEVRGADVGPGRRAAVLRVPPGAHRSELAALHCGLRRPQGRYR